MGDTSTGFALCRYRWALAGVVQTKIDCPEWDGHESCDLIVIAEQGLGEQIFYSSMYGSLPAAAIGTDPRLIPLLSRSFPQHRFIHIDSVNVCTTKRSRYVYTVDLAARMLPRANAGAWLTATDPEPYRKALAHNFGDTTKVGLSWRSRNSMFGDAKSIPCTNLLPLVSDPRITAIGLQYGMMAEDIAFWRENGSLLQVVNGLDTTHDLDRLADLIMALDVVVTCSNTTAHLAGALGKRTILIVPADFNLWYWGTGDRSPWYPSVQVIRKPDYASLADTVRKTTVPIDSPA